MASDEDFEKSKGHALDAYDACHKQVKKHGKTKATWKNCVGTAAMPLLALSMGPAAPAGRVVVEAVAGTLYDIGNALGLSNAEEEARLHAQQSAAWKSYETAWFKINALEAEGEKAFSQASSVVAKMRKDNNLPPKPFLFFWKRPSTLKFYQSIGIGPGDSSPDAGAVVSYAWKPHAEKVFSDYAIWFEKLDDAVSREAADIALTKAAKQKTKKQTSPVVKVAVVGGLGAAAWWAWNTFKLARYLR